MKRGIQALMSSRSKVSPVFIESSTTVSTTLSAAVMNLTSVTAGNLLVVTIGDNWGSPQDFAMSSSPVLTWTKQADASGTNTGNSEIWTAVFAVGGNITITATRSNGNITGGTAYAMRFAEQTLGGASGTEINASAPSVTLSTTREFSILFGITFDWNGVDGASRTLRDTATETNYYHPNGGGTAYVYYKQCAEIASHTLGVSSPTGQVAATAIYEIRSA